VSPSKSYVKELALKTSEYDCIEDEALKEVIKPDA
jgi:hypothetical protein